MVMQRSVTQEMRVALANLRTFYQHRVFLAMCVVCAVYAAASLLALGPGLEMLFGPSDLTVSIVVACAAGVLVGWLQRDILRKSFSFCLPGHLAAARTLVFIVGALLSLVLAITLFRRYTPRELGLAWSDLSMLAVFCAALTFYVVGLRIGFASQFAWLALLPLVGVTLAAPLGAAVGVESSIRRALLGSPKAIIVLGAVSTTLAWFWLGSSSGLWRGACRRAKSAKRASPVNSKIAMVVLSRMRRCGPATMAMNLWGTLYAFVLAAHPLSAVGFGLFLVAGVGATGIWPQMAPLLMAYMLEGGIASVSGHTPIHSRLVLPTGRRERFGATITLCLILGGLSALAVTLFILAANALIPLYVRPTTDFHSYGYHPVTLRFVLLELVLFPLTSLIAVRFHGRPVQSAIAYSVLFGACVLPLMLMGWDRESWAAVLPVIPLTIAAVAAWGLCVLGLHRIAMRHDLVRK
jgi:hypothetical protein